MSESPHNVATDDNRISAGDGTHQIVIKMEQPKESPWKQPGVYVAALALIVAVSGYFWRVAEDRAHWNDIAVWETDVFNRQKDIEAELKVRYDFNADKKDGKLRPPPIK